MKEKLNELLSSTKDALESFLTGDSTFNNSEGKYKKLLKEYDSYRNEILIESKEDGSHIEGMLYEHNINNFSKATAIYEKSGKHYKRINKFGEEKLLSLSDQFIKNSSQLIGELDIHENELKSVNSLKFILYAIKFNTDHGEFIISSISSSNYFSMEKYKFFCNIIYHIYSNNTKFSIPLSFNFVESLKMEIKDYISRLPIDEDEFTINFFYFKNINTIFSHMGIHACYDISDTILNMLNEYYESDSKILILSKNRYLILFKEKELENDNKKKKKKFFIFNNIVIKYNMMEFNFNKNLPLSLLFKELKEFEKTGS